MKFGSVSFFLVGLFFLGGVSYVHAYSVDQVKYDDVVSYDDKWTKLGRGAANVVTSPLEIIFQPYAVSKTKRVPVAITTGIFKGIAYGVKRFTYGLYEMATFYSPGDTNYGPIMEPEFVVPPS